MTLVDNLLQDTWLLVLAIQDRGTQPEDQAIHHQSIALVETARQALDEHGISPQNRDHILWVQCALLDESVLNHPGQEQPNTAWMSDPLQVHFFQSLDAGNQFYERVRQLLRQPAPDVAVLACYHRALILGFMGRYANDIHNPERQKLLTELSGKLPISHKPLSTPVVVSLKPTSHYHWYRSAGFLGGLALLAVVGLSLALQAQLQSLLHQWFPG